jgi:hypothetical protein
MIAVPGMAARRRAAGPQRWVGGGGDHHGDQEGGERLPPRGPLAGPFRSVDEVTAIPKTGRNRTADRQIPVRSNPPSTYQGGVPLRFAGRGVARLPGRLLRSVLRCGLEGAVRFGPGRSDLNSFLVVLYLLDNPKQEGSVLPRGRQHRCRKRQRDRASGLELEAATIPRWSLILRPLTAWLTLRPTGPLACRFGPVSCTGLADSPMDA